MTSSEFLRKSDPKLAEIIDLLPPPEIESTNDVFTDLIYLLVEHQVMPLLYGIDSKKKLKKNMLEIAKKWSSQRSLATRYLVDYRAWLKKQR